MLYYLTDSLIVDKTDSLYRDIYKCMRSLGEAAENSYHLLNGDYNILQKAKEWFKDDPTLSLLYNKLVVNFPSNPIPDCITYYIEIVKENPTTYNKGNKKVVQIEYNKILEPSNVTATSLICEDVNDCIFYTYVTNWYLKQNNINICIRKDDVQGGGSRTEECIKQQLMLKHVSICIIDTDKKYKDQELSRHTKDLCKLGKNAVFYKFVPLEVQEIENLIPYNFIDSLKDWDLGNLSKNKRAYDFLKKDAEVVLPYFDLKQGFKKNNEIQNDRKYYLFVQECYLLNEDLCKSQKSFEDYYNGLDNGETIYPGLMQGLLKKIITLIKDDNCPDPVLFPYQKKQWNNISQEMINWTIARNNEKLY